MRPPLRELNQDVSLAFRSVAAVWMCHLDVTYFGGRSRLSGCAHTGQFLPSASAASCSTEIAVLSGRADLVGTKRDCHPAFSAVPTGGVFLAETGAHDLSL